MDETTTRTIQLSPEAVAEMRTVILYSELRAAAVCAILTHRHYLEDDPAAAIASADMLVTSAQRIRDLLGQLTEVPA